MKSVMMNHRLPTDETQTSHRPSVVSPWLVCGKSVVVIIIAALSAASFAQGLTTLDNFEDGNYTSNPTWTVQAGTWSVLTDGGSYRLRDGDAAGSTSDVITTPLTQSTGTWEFKFRADYAASNATQFLRFYLIASSAAVNTNGYYMYINSDTTAADKRFRLYRRDGAAATLLLNMDSSYTPNTSTRTVRITRTTGNLFTVYLDSVQLGTTTDSTYTSSSYVVANVDSTVTADNFYLDDIRYSGSVIPPPTLGANIQLTTSTKDDTRADVAYNPVLNEYFVVYENQYSPNDYDVYGQRVSASGSLIGSRIAIRTSVDKEAKPRVAYSQNAQRYCVVMEYEDKDVVAVILDNTGATVVPAFFVDNFVTGQSLRPVVVWRKTEDDFTIVWQEKGTGNNFYMLGELINTDGTNKRDDIVLRRVNGVNLEFPSISYNDGLDQVFITYDNELDIFGFIFDGQMVYRLTDILTISNFTGVQIDADVIFNSVSKEWMVAWQDFRFGDYDIFARRINEDGTAFVADGFAIELSGQSDQTSELGYSATNNKYYVIYNHQNPNGNWDILARIVNADSSVEDYVRVAQPTQDPLTESSNEYFPQIAFNSTDNQFLSVWQDGRTGNFDVFAQRLTSSPISPPVAPTGFGHSANTTTSITWSWVDNTDETSYELHKQLDDSLVATTTQDVTSYSEGSLSENTQYARHVHAKNSGGLSPASNTANVYTSVHDPVAADFTLTVISSSQINVTVTAPPNGSADLTGVQIESAPDGTNFSVIKSFSNAYTFSHTGLLGNKTYTYRIKFRNGDGDQTAVSPTKQATTSPDATPPANPTGLVAVGGINKIDLSWNANSDPDLQGYNVYRSATSGGPYTKINGAVITSTTYSDSVGGGSTFYYVVRAVDLSNNESGNSNEASATAQGTDTTPPEPPLITTPSKKTNDNTPSISGNAEANSTVTVYYNGTNVLGTTTASGTGTFTVHNTANPLTDAAYSITAKATDAAGNTSAASAAITVTIDTVAPAPPDNLAATPLDSATLLEWTASTSSDALGYNVYRKLQSQPDTSYAKINSQLVTGTKFKDFSLTNGTAYCYRISAVDDAQNEKH